MDENRITTALFDATLAVAAIVLIGVVGHAYWTAADTLKEGEPITVTCKDAAETRTIRGDFLALAVIPQTGDASISAASPSGTVSLLITEATVCEIAVEEVDP